MVEMRGTASAQAVGRRFRSQQSAIEEVVIVIWIDLYRLRLAGSGGGLIRLDRLGQVE